MNMNMSVGSGSPESSIEKKSTFRQLVGSLVEGNELFPSVVIGNREPNMSIIDAIEGDHLVQYLDLSGYGSDERLSAVHFLTVIYDELQKENPDQELIAKTKKELQACL